MNARGHNPLRFDDTDLVSRSILGVRVDATSYDDASRRVIRWAHERTPAYVCVAAVHAVMESFDSAEFRRVVNRADLVTPDGRPLVWALKTLRVSGASQVRGTYLMTRVVEQAAREGIAIGLYGGTPDLLEELARALQAYAPGLQIACKIAPPFRELSPEEDEAFTRDMVASGAKILFVGIGCPKQERWMIAHKNRIPAVMLGVGAAFDFHAGRVRQAPRWMQAIGLEWAFRVMMDPRRLWKRYAKHNPRFVGLFLMQLLGFNLVDKRR